MPTTTTINHATVGRIQTCTVISGQAATDRIEACDAALLKWRKPAHHERAPVLTRIRQRLRGQGTGG